MKLEAKGLFVLKALFDYESLNLQDYLMDKNVIRENFFS